MQNMLAFGMPGWPEILVIVFIGLIIFGKRLPDVARSLGKSVTEFKKGIRDIKDDVGSESTQSSPRLNPPPPPPPLPDNSSSAKQESDNVASENKQ